MVVVDAQTFLIPNFTYDGQAPDAHFHVGRGARVGPEVEEVPRDLNARRAKNRVNVD